MNEKQFAKAAGFVFLCVLPALALAQSTAPAPVETSQPAASTVRTGNVPLPGEDFAGLELTEQQKATIEQIHNDMKQRMETVMKDEKETSEQKEAMLEGYHRMERNQVFQALTPEQQGMVRKRMLARRKAALEAKKKPPVVPASPR
jgi:Spy/CpxP family protein refolding chaperone